MTSEEHIKELGEISRLQKKHNLSPEEVFTLQLSLGYQKLAEEGIFYDSVKKKIIARHIKV